MFRERKGRIFVEFQGPTASSIVLKLYDDIELVDIRVKPVSCRTNITKQCTRYGSSCCYALRVDFVLKRVG